MLNVLPLAALTVKNGAYHGLWKTATTTFNNVGYGMLRRGCSFTAWLIDQRRAVDHAPFPPSPERELD
jgi:hypothetical protein